MLRFKKRKYEKSENFDSRLEVCGMGAAHATGGRLPSSCSPRHKKEKQPAQFSICVCE